MTFGRFALVGLVAVATGCGSASPHANSAADTRSTSDASSVPAPLPPSPVAPPPTVPPRPAANGLPPCTAAQLRGSVTGIQGITGGTSVGYLMLRNASGRNCSLAGTPAVTAYDVAGRPLRLRHVALDGYFSSRPRPVALLAHPRYREWSAAWVPISVSAYDDKGDPCPGADDVSIGRFDVSLGTGGAVAVHVVGNDAVGTCEGKIRTGWFLTPDGG